MVRRHAWAPLGERAIGCAPGGNWKAATVLTGLAAKGLIDPFVLDGPMNRIVFNEYVRQVLVPELKPGDIVILDNMPGHKGDEATALVEAAGARLLFPPSNTPDLNPVELLFSKLKTLLSKATSRPREALWTTIGTLVSEFSADECASHTLHVGYAS